MPDEKPLDPAAEQVYARFRRLMVLSMLFTGLAIATVFMVIGYRIFRGEGSAVPQAVTVAPLPAGARVTATSVSDGRLLVTVDSNGTTEVLSFDVQTLQPRGRLRLQAGP